MIEQQAGQRILMPDGMSARVIMPRGAAALAYYQKVLATQPANLLGYWPLWELAGLTADNLQGVAARDGTYTSGPTLNNALFANAVDPVPLFDGLNDYVNLYTSNGSTGLADVFNPAEGTLMIWAKVLNLGIWTDAQFRFLAHFGANDSNRIRLIRGSGNGVLTFDYRAGGASISVNVGSLALTTWFQAALTWSKSNDYVRRWIGGIQQGLDSTGLGNWVGSLVNQRCQFGVNLPGSFAFSGWLAHGAIWNTPLLKADILSLATVPVVGYTPVIDMAAIGDSITAGVGASDAAHRWVNIVATTKGWTFQNSGVSTTTLQNTAQNTVAIIGSSTAGNGRDNYISRVMNYYPEYVLCLYGLNDLRLNDVAFTTALFEDDLTEIIDALLVSGVSASKIVIGSPSYMTNYAAGAPYNAGSIVKHQAYVASCAAVAAAKGVTYIDVYQWMIDNGGAALLSADGIHPNDAGHAEIANAFLSVV